MLMQGTQDFSYEPNAALRMHIEQIMNFRKLAHNTLFAKNQLLDLSGFNQF